MAVAPPHISTHEATGHRAFRYIILKRDLRLRDVRLKTSFFVLSPRSYSVAVLSPFFKMMPLQSLLQKITMFTFFINSAYLFSQLNHNDSIILSINEYHKTLNTEFANSETSPLDSIDFIRFSALNIFLPNINYYVLATFKKNKKQKMFKMKTSTERKPTYIKYGEVEFILNSEKFKLNIYQNVELSKKSGYKNYLFLPFTDFTNGETTYGGGRYIDLEIPSGNSIVIDFNKAYNPYCAYSHKYSCPIPPPENFLNIKIEAGVKEGLIYK